MFLKRSQPLLCLAQRRFASPVHPQIRCNKWAHQPGPDCALMIRAISTSSISCVAASVLRIARGKAPQPVRREQMLLYGVDYLFRPLPTKHGMRQAYREDLIRTDA